MQKNSICNPFISYATQDTTVVNDVTGLNPVTVNQVATPSSLEQLIELVKTNTGILSIGGGHFSMGGQTATENSLHIDMRSFNQILNFNPSEKTITVQAGIRWREVQSFIDQHDLAVKIMQTYSNFTVGGSLSVNAHGRYIGQGPLILSVKKIKLILADGRVVEASPTEQSNLFFGAIGGYGGLGIIAEVTLSLADNIKIARTQVKLAAKDYYEYFLKNIRSNPHAIFHNADLYPPHYSSARAITWVATDEKVNVPERLINQNKSYSVERYFVWAIMTTPLGKWRREYLIDPLLYLSKKIAWRNFEAGSYDIAELEPKSRAKVTDVLQEYFVPINRFDEFLPKMVSILQRYHVNALNISVRHANQDPGALLAWAKEEVFAFVLYYRQGTNTVAKNAVALWTRELISAAIECGGSYYLPYQLHATLEQFHAAYPRAKDYFELKKSIDPDTVFRNKLWDKYYCDASEKSVESLLQETGSKFKAIYGNTVWRDKFYLFLQNVYRIYPENHFHTLIIEAVEKNQTDEAIYRDIQNKLPSIKPFLSDLRYAAPALSKQKKIISEQTLSLLDDFKTINGYIEIGSPGRYISKLRHRLTISQPIYLVDEQAPSYSPPDIMERGRLFKIGQYFPLNNYDPLSETIASSSIDLVTCYIGLHHAPLNKLDPFIKSIARVLRPGGRFIVRDHDVTDETMRVFVSLVHTVFNAGLNINWEENRNELHNFTKLNDMIALVESSGFHFSGEKILQDYDPSLNTLVQFIKK